MATVKNCTDNQYRCCGHARVITGTNIYCWYWCILKQSPRVTVGIITKYISLVLTAVGLVTGVAAVVVAVALPDWWDAATILTLELAGLAFRFGTCTWRQRGRNGSNCIARFSFCLRLIVIRFWGSRSAQLFQNQLPLSELAENQRETKSPSLSRTRSASWLINSVFFFFKNKCNLQ